jgi:hypothetical protein
MATAEIQEVPAAVIRKCIDVLKSNGATRLSAAEFVRFLEANGYRVGDSCQAMIQRQLDGAGERPGREALKMAADELVAMCEGRIDDAVAVLQACTTRSGNDPGVEVYASQRSPPRA